MVFSSNIFLLAFLPLFLITYYLTPDKFRSIPILIGSYIFYAWWRIDFMALFAGVTLWNYLIYKKIVSSSTPDKKWMQIGVAGNLLTLGFFKYTNFGVDSLNAVLTQMGGHPIEVMAIILPIGISFYIFQAISFLIDVYRKDAPHPKNFWDFAAFISLFPQLIAGPILRYKDVAEQFQSRTHSLDKFSEGSYRFMVGFAQKVLIADSVAPIADKVFAVSNPTFTEAWLGAL
ncbi:MAG TPA: MBOAT family O-acyltransferase, partial [Emcibacteraceae bacterium]|nr:MBOAT family O-acyltransferase [Emcibacteraceae bacterium]